ncbi:MAG: hypothetical protein Q9Q40_13605, partial [Acidobacteriota bacterium]|nr:hypothetical protein [Acidobacteriota bacterium]
RIRPRMLEKRRPAMARGRSQRVRRSEEEWREILERFEASKLSLRAFCRQEQIGIASLHRWRKRLALALGPGFVDLRPPSVVGNHEGWELDLELPGGGRLRLRG